MNPNSMRLLLIVLAMTAGSVDVISFLGLGGLFNAHITGNLVILAARIIADNRAPIAVILSVPVFLLVLGLSRLLVRRLSSMKIASLGPMLLLECVLLAGFFELCIPASTRVNPDAAIAVLAGMLGVSAMAVQNVLVAVSLDGAPSTTAMTANLTHFMIDFTDTLVLRTRNDVSAARRRANQAWPTIVGFVIGCGVGAAGEAAFALRSVAIPLALALVALALSQRRGVLAAARLR
jgi:uncharacterized membrane protein YoaK (UPF0700 family)